MDLSVGGLSLTDATQIVKSKVNTTYIGTEAFVSLASLRDINVLVSGGAYNPGIYTVSGIQMYCMFWELLEALMNMLVIEKST